LKQSFVLSHEVVKDLFPVQVKSTALELNSQLMQCASGVEAMALFSWNYLPPTIV